MAMATQKHSINDHAFDASSSSLPQAKKIKTMEEVVPSDLVMMMMLRRCQQEKGELVHGGVDGGSNINIPPAYQYHHQPPPPVVASSLYNPVGCAFVPEDRSTSSSHTLTPSCSTTAIGIPARYAWAPPPPSPPLPVAADASVKQHSPHHGAVVVMPPQLPPVNTNICTTATAMGGGPNDDYIQEQQYMMETIPCPSAHPPPHPNTMRLDMLSSVVSGEVAVAAKRTAVVISEDKSIPGWLPKNPESSSSSPRPNPVVVVNDGDPSYKGERHPTTNLRHGFGIMSYRDGSVYTGNFEHDKRHGFGKCWYPDGLGVYTGFWANGKRNGLGKMVYSNGEVYHGEWLADLPYPADSR